MLGIALGVALGYGVHLVNRAAVRRTDLVELLADDMPEVNLCESTAIDPDAPCYAGPEGLRYRITARSGEEGRAVVILQSVYAVPKPAGW